MKTFTCSKSASVGLTGLFGCTRKLDKIINVKMTFPSQQPTILCHVEFVDDHIPEKIPRTQRVSATLITFDV